MSTQAAIPTGTEDAPRQPIAKAKDAIGPLAEKAKAFAKERPYATATLAGVIGLALLNTLRGRS